MSDPVAIDGEVRVLVSPESNTRIMAVQEWFTLDYEIDVSAPFAVGRQSAVTVSVHGCGQCDYATAKAKLRALSPYAVEAARFTAEACGLRLAFWIGRPDDVRKAKRDRVVTLLNRLSPEDRTYVRHVLGGDWGKGAG